MATKHKTSPASMGLMIRTPVAFPPDLHRTLEHVIGTSKASIEWLVLNVAEKDITDRRSLMTDKA